jgi:hypothetical protein
MVVGCAANAGRDKNHHVVRGKEAFHDFFCRMYAATNYKLRSA